MVVVDVDESKPIEFIDVFYSQQGQLSNGKDNSENTKNRFWHHASVSKQNGKWTARMPIYSRNKPLWVFANVRYKLTEPIIGAGYYYGIYRTEDFNLSSLPKLIDSEKLQASQSLASLKPSLLIEDFKGDWRKEWFTYKPAEWGLRTHKIYHPIWHAPKEARLTFEVKSRSCQ